jgi:hypothetical protein
MTGAKDITYVPANGLVAPMQKYDPYSNPQSYMIWVHRDPLGIQENNSNGSLSAYDPLGNLVANVQPPVVGPPPNMPVYGATYGGLSWNSFINANNFSQGCVVDGRPALCTDLTDKLGNGELDKVTTYIGFNPASLGLVLGSQEQKVWTINEWVPKSVPAWSHMGQSFAEAEPQNTGYEFAHTRPSPCPPTGEQLAANKTIRDAIHETSKKADEFRDTHGYWIEHGGWIYANLKTGKVATNIKDPSTSPPFAKDYPYLDGAVKVYLNDPPPPPKGWEIVGKFHVHPDDDWNPETDGAAADQNKVPGLVGTPNGTIYVGGKYKRGIWNSDLPARCR